MKKILLYALLVFGVIAVIYSAIMLFIGDPSEAKVEPGGKKPGKRNNEVFPETPVEEPKAAES